MNDESGILLVESKFTEKGFYRCSGYNQTRNGKPSNPDNKRCLDTIRLLESDFSDCHLVSWGRQYWHLLKGELDKAFFSSLKKCPALNCYQLLRQQALAQGYKKRYDLAYSCVAADQRSERLAYSARSVGLSTLPDGLQELFPRVSLPWFHHNDWFRYVQSHNNSGEWDSWIRYVGDRYF